jgi:hypothetical protein
MQRLLLAIIAAALTLAGGVMLWFYPGDYQVAAPVCLRSGLVLGALALALPQVQRLFEITPPWFLGSVALGFIVIIRWPKAIGIVLPVLAVMWFLGPRAKLSAEKKNKSKRR